LQFFGWCGILFIVNLHKGGVFMLDYKNYKLAIMVLILMAAIVIAGIIKGDPLTGLVLALGMGFVVVSLFLISFFLLLALLFGGLSFLFGGSSRTKRR